MSDSADGRQPEKESALWKEKYRKDLAASWAKGRLIWQKKKKDDVKADPNKKKKREKDKEGEINEEEEDKDNKVEDNDYWWMK